MVVTETLNKNQRNVLGLEKKKKPIGDFTLVSP